MEHPDSFARSLRDLLGLLLLAGKWILGVILLLRLLESVVPLATSWLVKVLFDELGASLSRGGGRELSANLVTPLVLYAGLTVFRNGIAYVERYFSEQLDHRLHIEMHAAIYRKIQEFAGILYFEDANFHDKIQWALQGAQQASAGFLMTAGELAKSAFTLLGFLGALFALNPIFACLIAAVSVPQLVIRRRISEQRLQAHQRSTHSQRRALYYSRILTGPAFAKELRLFNLGGYFLNLWRQTSQVIHDAIHAQTTRELKWGGILSVVSALVYVSSFVYVVVFAFRGRLSIGDVSFYTSAVMSVQAGFTGLFQGVSNVREAIFFIDRYRELMEMPQPIRVSQSPRTGNLEGCTVEFRGVSFRYSNDGPWVLRDINLRIPNGSCLALVGDNGSGKSTVVKLLLRLYDPSEGVILWNGIDARDIDPLILRSRITAIFQDFVRFELTARENIGLGDATKLESDEEIRSAAARAGIGGAIETLPRSYDTVLSRTLAFGQSGTDLSGGEWQKVALARMLVRESDLMILDEPSASLDLGAEKTLLQTLSGLLEDHTALLISHRLAIAGLASQIAVLRDGCLVESGTHKDLMRSDRLYASMYRMQADEYGLVGL